MNHLLRHRAMLHRQKSISKYFVDKIDQRVIDGATHPDYTMHVGSSCSAFKQTTTKEAEDLITAAPNKHSILDPVPTSLVKNCASLLAP